MQASKELWELVLLLTKTDKESFEGGLEAWYIKWVGFLNERKPDSKGKNRYIHKSSEVLVEAKNKLALALYLV